jgi:hypothetical protein
MSYEENPHGCEGTGAAIDRIPVCCLLTINRRGVLFFIYFIQLFLGEKVVKTTKMTSDNLVLVL